MKMEAGDVINLGSPRYSGSEIKNDERDYSENRVKVARFRACNFTNQERSVYIDLTEDNYGGKVNCLVVEEENVKDVACSSFSEDNSGFADTNMATDNRFNFQHRSCPTCKAKVGAKRLRKASDERKPSVHVIYDSLTRDSKRKLEELLRKWSEWQAEQDSIQDPDQVLESGEETYLAAIRVGVGNSSFVSYCIDNQVAKKDIKGSALLDSSSVPYYDRGFALGLNLEKDLADMDRGLEVMDNPSCCFNCGSYSHQLKQCPKPWDNVAVKNSLELYRSKRNHNFGPNVPIRYYQSALGGKYNGLKQDALCEEKGKLLRQERDPPPWLNRKGYPSAYLCPDEENGPSGITIYADGEIEEEQRDCKKLFPKDPLKFLKKKTVEVLEINTEIPAKLDRRPRASQSSNSSHLPRKPLQHSSHFQEPTSLRYFQHQTRQGDLRHHGLHELEGPFIRPSMDSHPPRYGFYDDNRFRRHGIGELDSFRRPLSPTMERYEIYRDRLSPLTYIEEFSDRDRFSNLQHPSSYPWDDAPLEEQNPYLGHGFNYDSYAHRRWQ